MKTYCTKLLMIALILISCNKNAENIVSQFGKGSFTFQNEKYEGGIVTKLPSSQGLLNEFDVTINCPPGNAVIVYNMPNSSSGSFLLNDPLSANVFGSNKPWIVVVFQPNTTFHQQSEAIYSSAGTITKTGLNSFSFTSQVYYSSKPSQKYTVTGKGSY